MSVLPLHPHDDSVADSHLERSVRELASGVDALYLSGRTVLPGRLLERLEEARQWAEALSTPISFDLGDESFALTPNAFGRYRYCLEHPDGRVGISPSSRLPPLRIQPRTAYLHTVGPAAAAAHFEEVLTTACGEVQLSVSRIDLYADFEGWHLGADDRRRFSCRSTSIRTFEEGDRLTGFEFGRRSTKTVNARIYDKTADIARTGADWWFDIWHRQPNDGVVHRVELEWNRTGLAQFDLLRVDETLAAVGDLWRYGTSEWLTHRTPTSDTNPARWPVSAEWRCVRQAQIAGRTLGVMRMHRLARAGSLRLLTPALVGYLVGFAVLSGTTGIDDTVSALRHHLRRDESIRAMAFAERVRRRRLEGGGR